MGCGYQSALTAVDEGKDGHSIISKPSGADDGCWTSAAYSLEADIMSVPFSSLDFSRPDIKGDFYPYPPDLNCLPDPTNDGNLINAICETSEFCRESEMSYPNVSMREPSNGIDGCDSPPADYFMNANVTSSGHGRSEVHMGFMPPRWETTTGYPITVHGVEARNSRTNVLMRGKFTPSECSTSLLPLVDSFGATGNKNDINTIMPSFSSPQKPDRNFLTLGFGNCTEIKPNSNFSTREIASKLEEASWDCNYSTVRNCPMNPMSLTQSMGRAGRVRTSAGGPNNNLSTEEIASKLEGFTVRHCPTNPLDLIQGSAGRIRTSSGGLSSSACSLANRMPTRDEGGLNRDTGFKLNSITSSSPQTPQANAESNFSQKCFTSVFDSIPLSLPFGSTLISLPTCGSQPELTSSYLASKPISQQQNYCRENSMEVSSESSRKGLSHRHNQGSIDHIQLGSLIPLAGGGSQSNADLHFPNIVRPARIPTLSAEDTRTAAAKIGSYGPNVHPFGRLNTHNFAPIEALHNNSYRSGFQTSKSGTLLSATAGSFPKRLGLQPNDFATGRTTRGPPPAALFNPIRPSASAGQYQHWGAAKLSKDLPRVECSNGQFNPVAKSDVKPQLSPVTSHPYLKRKAAENLASACSAHHRKIIPQPAMHHSSPILPPAPVHVKWQGFNDEPIERTGEKCLLCKRDLLFTAEGQVFQPAAPPPVAVLPCGHTFHDHCLQVITPEDQLHTPPCIPCAIGES